MFLDSELRHEERAEICLRSIWRDFVFIFDDNAQVKSRRWFGFFMFLSSSSVTKKRDSKVDEAVSNDGDELKVTVSFVDNPKSLPARAQLDERRANICTVFGFIFKNFNLERVRK